MGRTAVVLEFDRSEDGPDVKADPGGGANVTAPHYSAPGDDSAPLPGDVVAMSRSNGTGAEHVTGYHDGKNDGIAKAGEKRIYARDPAGVVVAEVYLQGDGTILFKNASGAGTLNPDGSMTLNGAKVTLTGDVITASGVSLDLHVHPTPMGPSGPPTPSAPP